jgi:hypothetical protein
LARRVAERYLEGVYNFCDADAAMNHLFAWGTSVTGNDLPQFVSKMFEAFDAGEFLRPGAPEERQGEALTQALLAERVQTER